MSSVPAHRSREVRLLHEPCQACGRPIEVVSPEWYRITFNLQNPKDYRATWQYDPVGNAFCVTHQLERVDAAHRDALEAKLATLRTRKGIIGLPDNVTLFHHRTRNSHVWGAVNGVFNFDEYFCHVRGSTPDAWTIPRRIIRPDDGSHPLTLLYVASDVHLQDVDAKAVLTWDIRRPTDEGRLQIQGWSQQSPANLSRLMEGVRVFLQRQPSGRPRGTTDHSIADYQQAFQQVMSTLGRPVRSQREFCDMTGFSPDTVKRNLKRWGTTWGAFRREQSAQQLLSSPARS